MSALRNTHGHPFLRATSVGQADKTQNNGITPSGRLFQKSQLVTRWIRKDGLENKTLALIHQFLSQRCGNFRCLIIINAQFPGQNIRIDKTQAAGFEMGFVKSGFPRAIRTRHGDDYGAFVQIRNVPCARNFRRRLFHLQARANASLVFLADLLTGWNCR